MLTHTCNTQVQISLSAPNASGQAQPQPRGWGQGSQRLNVYTEEEEHVPLRHIKELREAQTDRRTIYCGNRFSPFMAQFPQKSQNRRNSSGNIY